MKNLREENISETIESNYMPYAMSVIISRAIPEIDGFKPAHRKLLYTMYKMNLLDSSRTKSANVVGQTMRLNPHGDMAIYETMVRLTKGNDALLYPYIDSKGNFGKITSRDISFAASRYTEVKLSKICSEIFKDIDKNSVKFIENYDSSMLEPILLPTTFPNILVNPNIGIAVGMSCNFPSFNLAEVCDFTIEKLNNDDNTYVDVKKYIIAPDFSTGGSIVKNDEEFDKIYNTGIGTIKIRAKYKYNKLENIIEIYEIPYTTTVEAIIEKVLQLIKLNKLKEIIDIRDETGLDGLKIAIDVRKNVDIDILMTKLFKLTSLESTFSCNFNLLINSRPQVLGINGIIDNWIEFRIQCLKNVINYELENLKNKLHLLNAFEIIILDIDKAIKIIRNTEYEKDIIKNLILNFSIDEVQAEYISNIKLRNLNKEYLLNRINEKNEIEKQILENEDLISSKQKLKKYIILELKKIKKNYSQERKTNLIEIQDNNLNIDNEIEDYGIKLFLTKEGYFKKISNISYKMASLQKLKENDIILKEIDSTNLSEILFFSDKCNVYKLKAHELNDTKASEIGYFLNNLLNLEENENIISILSTIDFKGYLLFGYENGKVAKVLLKSYETKTNRKKLVNAMSDKSKCISIIYIKEDIDLIMTRKNLKNNIENMIIFNTNLLNEKVTKNTQGVQCFSMTKNSICTKLEIFEEFENFEIYKIESIPKSGEIIKNKE